MPPDQLHGRLLHGRLLHVRKTIKNNLFFKVFGVQRLKNLITAANIQLQQLKIQLQPLKNQLQQLKIQSQQLDI